MTRLVAAALLVLSACGSFSQQRFEQGTGTLTGRVVDAEGRPAEAIVSRADAQGRARARTATDASGGFTLSNVPVGKVRLAAFELSGQLAIADTVAVGDTVRDVGVLTLSSVSLSGAYIAALGFEQRLTSGPPVVEAHATRDAAGVLWKTEDGTWRVAEVTDQLELVTRTLTLPAGAVAAVGLGFVWGLDGTELWRVALADGRVERAPRCDYSCGVVGLSGSGLAYTHQTPESLFEEWMPGALLLWRTDAVLPVTLDDARPDGMSPPVLSGDGRSVAFARRVFNLGPTGQVVRLRLEDRTLTSRDGDPVWGLAFSPADAVAVLRKSPSGPTWFQLEGDTPKALQQPADRIAHDAAQQRWVVKSAASTDGWRAVDSAGAETAVVPVATEWLLSASTDAVVYARARDRFRQLFVMRGGHERELTSLAVEHRLVGVSGDGGYLLYLARDPQTGVEQLFGVFSGDR